MKKLTAKKVRHWAATATALTVLAALLLTFGYALPYVGTTAATGNTNAGLIGPAKTDVDNLFIYMMNQALPVGSIYMTQGISSAADMNNKYGGTWVAWGTGRAPAGVNPGGSFNNVLGSNTPNHQGTYRAQAPDEIGGFMNDVTPQTISFTPTLTLSGSGLSLSLGGMTLNTPNITWSGSVGVNNPSGNITGVSTAITVPLLNHTHPFTINLPSNGSFPSGDGSNVSAQVAGTASTYTLNVNNTGTNTSVAVPFSINLANWTASFSGLPPGINFVAPTISYTEQRFAASGTRQLDSSYFTASASTANIAYTNETVQPYVVVYMYKRTALANLNP